MLECLVRALSLFRLGRLGFADLDLLDLLQDLLGRLDRVNVLVNVVRRVARLIIGLHLLQLRFGFVEDVHAVENGVAELFDEDSIV